MVTLKTLSVASAGAAFILWGIGETAIAVPLSDAHLFNNVANYTTTISANNDEADIYFLNPANLNTGTYSFPIALLLQGANVDKSNYSNFARIVANYGFVVVVPNANNPLGSGADRNTPTIAQDVAVETVARWSGLFLRASVLYDLDAFNYVYSFGDALDPNVSVINHQ